MKLTHFIACLALGASAALAQGTVTFANTSSTLVTFDTSRGGPPALHGQPVPTGTTGDFADFRVALYWLNPATSSFEQLGAAVPIAPVAGRFSGGTRTTGTGTPAGASGTFLVRAWSHGSTYSSYEAALASGSSLLAIGESASFQNPTGGAGSPPGPAVALSGFTGLKVYPAPEPSTWLLGLCGGAVWLIAAARGKKERDSSP